MIRLVCKLVAVTVLVAVVFGCERRGRVEYEVNPWPLKRFEGHVIETEHYLIHTTVDDALFHRAAAYLAEGQYKRISKVLTVAPEGKMSGYVFSNRRQWEAFTRHRMGARAVSYLRIRDGGYSADDVVVLYYLGRYPTLAVLAHELFHSYLDCAGDEPVPAWVNEGLACFYEAHEWNDVTPVFTPDKNVFRQHGLAEAIQAERLFPLKDMLATHAGLVSRLPREKVATYYSQAWALVRFLREGRSGKYAAKFQKLVGELGTHQLVTRARACQAARGGEAISFGEAVFRQYITDDLDTFEQEFRAYLEELAGWAK